jgi:hypothetical protein
MNKLLSFFLAILFLISCGDKKTERTVSTTKIKEQDTISGFYTTQIHMDHGSKCDLSVQISKSENGYRYRLKTDLRDLEGKISFDRTDTNELSIIFEGIKWDEYEGDISDELEDDPSYEGTENIEIPIGIGARVGKDTLTFQNSGNSMNYYVKIGECDQKYIVLVKT